MAEKKARTTPRDFFLNLLSIVALYVSATSFGVLIFQYINILVPDVLDTVRYGGDTTGAIRFPIASLLVVFPVYVWSARFLEKEYEKDPARREVAVRRWLVYFTLFIASLAIIGDLVALVFRFLEGEITARFILKVLTIFLVAGSVFYYYLSGLRKEKDVWLRPFTYAVIGAVAVSVFGAFFVIGSPVEQKNRRIDQQRVFDLQIIQSEVIAFWQAKDVLPETLGELEDATRGVRIPTDPETGEPYDYMVSGPLAFELCATFTTESEDAISEVSIRDPFAGTWEHTAGRVCFEREIDPDFFGDAKPLFPA